MLSIYTPGTLLGTVRPRDKKRDMSLVDETNLRKSKYEACGEAWGTDQSMREELGRGAEGSQVKLKLNCDG